MYEQDNRSGAFDLARQRLAREDAERSAYLDDVLERRGFYAGELRRCEDCHQQLSRQHTGIYCKRCGNRRNERKRRAKARAKLAAKGIEVKE